MPAVSIEKLREYSGPFVSTLKMDGEHNILIWQYPDTDCTLVNSYGRFRTDLPVTREIASLLKDKYGDAGIGFTAILAGELYAVNDDGSRMLLRHVMHHIKAPSNEHEENRIRFALFDILSTNWEGADYWSKINGMRLIVEENGIKSSVVKAVRGVDWETVKRMWDEEIIKNKMEGLVVHYPGGMVKIKDISTMDMVIVGMSKKGERYQRGEAGSLLPAFMLPNGVFVIGSSVTVAVTSEQKDWYKWINDNQAGELVIENEGFVMCKPKRIMEIGAEAWYPYKDPKKVGLDFKDGKWTKLGLFPAVTGQKPRFIKGQDGKSHERLDKTVNPDDLRLTQCPDFDEDWLLPYMPKEEIPPKEFVWATATPSEIGAHLRALQTKMGVKSNPPVRRHTSITDKIKEVLSTYLNNSGGI
jgi:hypothetical protein